MTQAYTDSNTNTWGSSVPGSSIIPTEGASTKVGRQTRPSRIKIVHHPEYDRWLREWYKYRLTYTAGYEFIYYYLRRFSDRENQYDFDNRMAMAYVPAFAKAAVNDIKNSIFQRLSEITRKGGSTSYIQAVKGIGPGVDLYGSSMVSYLGRKIIPELLSMGKVGIFVDNNPTVGPSVLSPSCPYIYFYPAEAILSWMYIGPTLTSVLLEDTQYMTDMDTGLPWQTVKMYRLLQRVDTEVGPRVKVSFYSLAGQNVVDRPPFFLDISEIPMVICDLGYSLLCDAADYQIALLNLESSDLYYAFKSNFPFYTEQYDPNNDLSHLRSGSEIAKDGTSFQANQAEEKTITVGGLKGRRYPKGTERPQFVNPSKEPLEISMAKQSVMKEDIRTLVNMAVSNLPPRESAAGIQLDERTIESGLAYIGLVLETMERKVAKIWQSYEGINEDDQITTIKYPEQFTLLTEDDRRKNAANLKALVNAVPSVTFRKTLAKKIATMLVGHKLSEEQMQLVNKEIDDAIVVDVDPNNIAQDVINGLVSPDTASQARGYPPGEAAKAQVAQAQRLAIVQAAQTTGVKAPGIKDRQTLDANQERKTKDKLSAVTPENDDFNKGPQKANPTILNQATPEELISLPGNGISNITGSQQDTEIPNIN